MRCVELGRADGFTEQRFRRCPLDHLEFRQLLDAVPVRSHGFVVRVEQDLRRIDKLVRAQYAQHVVELKRRRFVVVPYVVYDIRHLKVRCMFRLLLQSYGKIIVRPRRGCFGPYVL